MYAALNGTVKEPSFKKAVEKFYEKRCQYDNTVLERAGLKWVQ
jgi:hypothetical protein